MKLTFFARWPLTIHCLPTCRLAGLGERSLILWPIRLITSIISNCPAVRWPPINLRKQYRYVQTHTHESKKATLKLSPPWVTSKASRHTLHYLGRVQLWPSSNGTEAVDVNYDGHTFGRKGDPRYQHIMSAFKYRFNGWLRCHTRISRYQVMFEMSSKTWNIK